ncbi:MAG TPA: DUF6766 family protein [Caulobacteraceae bacterium]|jgi:hypothetical protein
MKRYSFLWVTGAFFLITLGLHWLFGWYAFVGEATQHGQAPQVHDYLMEMGRDTFENWQSEFLQLCWQIAGLAFLYYAGSPGSRGDDERMEAKLDALLRKMNPDEADDLIRSLDKQWPGR